MERATIKDVLESHKTEDNLIVDQALPLKKSKELDRANQHKIKWYGENLSRYKSLHCGKIHPQESKN